MRAATRSPLRRGPALGLALLMAASLILWSASLGKWSDPLIDSGSEWIYADALSRGALLYRDVVYWFGPLTPYFHALFFALFGSSFQSLAVAGVVGSLGTLAALYLALRRVTAPPEAAIWTALAIPALVFMPHAGGSIIGMGYRIWHPATFALLAVAVGVGGRSRSPLIAPLAAGSLAALAGLSRTEWGLAAWAAASLAVALRSRRRGSTGRDVALVTAGFAAVFATGLGIFVIAAGPEAVFRDGHVLLTGLPAETRTFLVRFSGIRDWRRGLLELLYSAGMWAGAFLAILILTLWKKESPRARCQRVLSLGGLLALLGVTALLGGASGAVLFSGAPAIALAALAVGVRRGRGPRHAALVAYGFLGLVLSYRRPFHIGDSAYVAPPLLFAFVSAAGLLRAALRGRGRARRPLRRALNVAVLLAVGLAFIGRSVQYRSDDRVPVPGTAGMLRAWPLRSREIAALAGAIRSRTREGDGLVVFPEGQILNFLSGRGNPVRHKLFIPGYLSEENEERILAELQRSAPRAVVIWRRASPEYGRGFFGEDYGRRIARWIDAHYAMAPFVPEGRGPRAHATFLLGLRKEDPE